MEGVLRRLELWAVKSCKAGSKKAHKDLWKEVMEAWKAGTVPTLGELAEMVLMDTSQEPFPHARTFVPPPTALPVDAGDAAIDAEASGSDVPPPPPPPDDARPPPLKKRKWELKK